MKKICIIAAVFMSVMLISSCGKSNPADASTSPRGKYMVSYYINACANSSYADNSLVMASVKRTTGSTGITTVDYPWENMCVIRGGGNDYEFRTGESISFTADCTSVTVNGAVTQMMLMKGDLKIEAYDSVSGLTRMWSNNEDYIGPVAQTSTVSATLVQRLP